MKKKLLTAKRKQLAEFYVTLPSKTMNGSMMSGYPLRGLTT